MGETDAGRESPAGAGTTGEGGSGDIARRALRIKALILAAGVLAGHAAWVAGEPLREAVRPRWSGFQSPLGIRKFIAPRDRAAADTRNASLTFAVLGGLLGAGLGAAGGLGRRDGRAAATAGLLGLALGAAVGGGVTWLIVPPYFAHQMRSPDAALQDLFWPLLVHLALWMPLGAVGGLAFVVGLAPRGHTAAIILGGLIGAALGTAVYELIGALAFPSSGTTRVISGTVATRLLARAAVAVFAAAGVATGLTIELTRGDATPRAPDGSA